MTDDDKTNKDHGSEAEATVEDDTNAASEAVDQDQPSVDSAADTKAAADREFGPGKQEVDKTGYIPERPPTMSTSQDTLADTTQSEGARESCRQCVGDLLFTQCTRKSDDHVTIYTCCPNGGGHGCWDIQEVPDGPGIR